MRINPANARHPRRWTGRWLAMAGALILITVTPAGASATAGQGEHAVAVASAVPAVAQPAADAAGLSTQPACGVPAAGRAACLALVDTGVHWGGHAWATGPALAARPKTSPADTMPPVTASAASAATVPVPYMAADLQSAYNLPSALLGARQTIAIVDAYDDPNAASDLAVYRAANNLPACDSAFPCFEKVNQDGQQGNYPPSGAGTGWPIEESLDVDMASAICPNCKIILVEANSNDDSDLFAAEAEAATLGANVISNSWGEAEYAGEQADCAQYFDPSGIAVTAASGDSGFGVGMPAACADVTAVGGTSLYREAGSPRGWGQLAWEYSGSGCSAYIPKPAWQHDGLCGMRTVADVSAVADPDTPVALYDSYNGEGGWIAVGGTSVAAPIIAGVYALAGNTATIGQGASWVYAHPGALSDVTYQASPASVSPQSNGDCGDSYLCTAAPGYDGPTGLGTPDGIGGF